MPSTITYMFIVFAIVLVAFGVLIKHYKCYWLISGYNLASKEEKAKYDIVPLGNLMAKLCFAMAAVFGVAAALAYFKVNAGILPAVLSVFIIVPYFVIKAQSYSPGGTSSTQSKIAIGLVIGVLIVSGILVGTLFTHGNKETQVIVSDNLIDIKGPYSSKYSIKGIENIELKDTIPEILSKSIGYDMGSSQKGDFNLKGIGGARLYVNNEKGPYIYIKKEGKYIIINLKDENKTRELYDSIKAASDKVK
ncbi:DUF3784 domain-containing protein [Clostridium sp. YIM B02515]|uniref:DUF3784 domain-containing protein n=1 Tax=Clostridium rhizosphaerae TaxID=2803861 RepID=A0ABS1TDE2_9CLOT|nr:DUF3784 domain-containing protein [Clostridium rhizosphaerae]MBL4937256.1 DUF3784 domain-containing protein [Clostridium rhizosphaerae]